MEGIIFSQLFLLFLRRAGPLIVNKSCVVMCLQFVQEINIDMFFITTGFLSWLEEYLSVLSGSLRDGSRNEI